jgi:hypothetical protein
MQPRYCVLDLSKFVFRYAKNPSAVFKIIHLREIVDVVIDEEKKAGRKKGFFESITRMSADKSGFGFKLIA